MVICYGYVDLELVCSFLYFFLIAKLNVVCGILSIGCYIIVNWNGKRESDFYPKACVRNIIKCNYCNGNIHWVLRTKTKILHVWFQELKNFYVMSFIKTHVYPMWPILLDRFKVIFFLSNIMVHSASGEN